MPISAREREIRRQTRLQVRYERLLEREMRSALTSFASDASRNQGLLRGRTRHYEARIEKVLIIRLRIVSRLFGDDALSRINKQKSASELFEIKTAFAQFENAISRWLREYAAKKAAEITESFRKWLAGVLADANNEGLGEVETAKRIRNRAKKMSRTRAERIARTETHAASQRGAFEAAKASSIDLAKEWASSEDSRVRSSHADVDGTTLLDLDASFRVGNSDMLYPSHEDGEAKEIINCRCVALYHPVIDGEVLR